MPRRKVERRWRRVRLHCTGGVSVEGVLVDRVGPLNGGYYVLRDVSILRQAEQDGRPAFDEHRRPIIVETEIKGDVLYEVPRHTVLGREVKPS